MKKINEIVNEIINDLNDRSGIGFDMIDEDIMKEIREDLAKIIKKHL